MPKPLLLIAAILLGGSIFAQPVYQTKANYQLAAKYSPTRLGKSLFSTTVDPHWLKKSNRFWYMYETTDGKKWYIVDPARGEKKLLFDNEKSNR